MGYFFHPLGELAPNYSEASYYSYIGHGVECIDIGVKSGTNIYSMTSGKVYFAGEGTSSSGFNGYGGLVVVETTTTAYTQFIGKTLYILYSHLKSWEVDKDQEIQAGTLIGLSGGAPEDPYRGQATGAHLHLEFRNEIESRYKASEGLLTGETSHISNWNNVKNWSLFSNIDNSPVIKIGSSFSYCHAICSQTPEYIQGGTEPNPTVEVPSEYLTYIFSSRFMGSYPENTSNIENEEYRALRVMVNAAHNEFGYGNEATSYGKLFRAWILYHFTNDYNFRASDATLDTFANAWISWVTAWGYDSSSFTEMPDDVDAETYLIYMQNMYKNISNPGIFGLDTNLENYEEAMIACSNMPFSNETSGEGTNTPVTHGNKLIFSVISPFRGWGWYVLFRFENSLMSANTTVLK